MVILTGCMTVRFPACTGNLSVRSPTFTSLPWDQDAIAHGSAASSQQTRRALKLTCDYLKLHTGKARVRVGRPNDPATEPRQYSGHGG
jgi:hypothetical protein